MKASTRYILIALGFVVFFVAAPILILYVSGRTVNFDSHDTNSTGILDSKSNPSGAKVTIDDKAYDPTPSIARFLKQGEYNVTITKDGYYDWSKRLPIESGKVTYAQEGVTELQLIKKSQSQILVPSGVSTFVVINDQLWYGRGNNIVTAPIDNPDKKTTISAGFPVTTMVELRDKAHLYIGNAALLDINSKKIITLPILKSAGNVDPYTINVTGDGTVLYLDNHSELVAFNPDTKQKWSLNQTVSAITVLGNTVYYVSGNGALTIASWDGSRLSNPQTNIALPDAKHLFVTDNKEVFCECGAGLQRVGQKLEPLASGNVVPQLDLTSNEFAFLSNHSELMFYNFLTSMPQLLTRGDLDQQAVFVLRSSIGYGFVGTKRGLEAIEIDSRDKQNRYQLISGKQVWQIGFSNDQKTILALVDGSIESIDIRN